MSKVFAIRVTHPSDPGRVQWFSWTTGTEDDVENAVLFTERKTAEGIRDLCGMYSIEGYEAEVVER